eukprot:scaffold120359_cov41-Attheya_sp.AAC.1
MSASRRFLGLENATTIRLKLEWDSASNLDAADMKRCAKCVALCPLSRFWVQNRRRLPNTRPFRIPSGCADKGGI